MDFEAHREHLWGIAYRMLGSRSEADDAVQEAWLRLHRTDVTGIANPRGWLTTVVARICLDVLRARATHREMPLDDVDPVDPACEPEAQAVLADSIGVALMVVLRTLSPAERLALVLHDVFDVSFAEIGPIIDRSANAAAQLTVRARRRVRGTPVDAVDVERPVVDAFLAAARGGDFDGLLRLLHPDVELRADAVAAGGTAMTFRGAREVAGRARMFSSNARFAEAALIDDAVGVVVAPDGVLTLVLRFTVDDGVVTGIEIVADPTRLAGFDIKLAG